MRSVAAILLGTGLLYTGSASAQPGAPGMSPRDAAPVDLTGTWVAPVMEDWRWRMVTPLKGDAASIPVRASARAEIDNWDPARDEAAGLACKGYGAAGLMRLPGRIRIEWADEQTLVIEKDYGMQTRRLHFDQSLPSAPGLQGHSQARWNSGTNAGPWSLPRAIGPRLGAQSKSLVVETSNLLPGYLRKNGIPYSDQTTMTEYFDLFTVVDGTEWITITTIVEDPVYLAFPYVTTTDYKREPDDSGWSPEPCSAH
jgi:hypothetical protein